MTSVMSCRWCPEEDAGWLSRLFFFFANSLVDKGARKHLEQSDLWDIADQDQPQRLWDRFKQQLQATANLKAPQVSLLSISINIGSSSIILPFFFSACNCCAQQQQQQQQSGLLLESNAYGIMLVQCASWH